MSKWLSGCGFISGSVLILHGSCVECNVKHRPWILFGIRLQSQMRSTGLTSFLERREPGLYAYALTRGVYLRALHYVHNT